MWNGLEERCRELFPKAGYCSFRLVREKKESLSVRRDILQPVASSENLGAMVTVVQGGGMGYGATCDLTKKGLARAVEDAAAWARVCARHGAVDYSRIVFPRSQGEYETPTQVAWSEVPLREKVELLRDLNQRLKTDDRIADWEASLFNKEAETIFITADGGRVRQRFRYLLPGMGVYANAGAETVRRTFGGRLRCRQGGWEVVEGFDLAEAAPRVSEEALALLAAPNCPSEKMDLLLDPDQMILQIHESIGHPLELDRILGDERNYAGTSFVTRDMFGGYRFGSDLLNVTFDPSRPEEFASFGFDDWGVPARKEYIIREGILLRGLGGLISQARAELPGVACSRATNWNRPPIDRMANLNIEPGGSGFDEMVAGVDRGILMKTNCSWSIDDSRLKFQFGCEWGQLIEGGRLTQVVKKPSYRGITPEFWRSLKMVGGGDTFEALGTPNCGKGEPNQAINVGHASPACLFAGVEVFGGEQG